MEQPIIQSPIYTEMRDVAKRGGNVAAIIDGMNRIEKMDSKIRISLYFCDCFNLRIPEILPLLRWNFFGNDHEDGTLSDSEIDQILMPLIRKNLGIEDWSEKQS